MNGASSRSHSLLVVGVESSHEESGEKTVAKMHLVDLAGSERVAKTGAHGTRLKVRIWFGAVNVLTISQLFFIFFVFICRFSLPVISRSLDGRTDR